MAVFKRWNGVNWEIIGPTISDSRINTVEELIAPEYDPNSPYSVGDFVVHSDTLYKCNTAIGSDGELWNSTHWTETKIGDEVSDLKSAIKDTVGFINQNLYRSITSVDGTAITSSRCLVTVDDGVFSFACTANGSFYFGVASAVGITYTPAQGQRIPCIPGETLHVVLSNSSFNNNYITFYDADGLSLGYTNYNVSSFDIVVPSDAYFCVLRTGRSGTNGQSYSTKITIAKDITETMQKQLDDLISSLNAFLNALSQSPYTVQLGYYTLQALTTGVANTAIGYQTLNRLTSGNYNAAIGHMSGTTLETGVSNVLIGSESNTAATDTNEGTAIGHGAITGKRSVAIGRGARATHENAGAIGFEVASTADNEYVFGRESNLTRFPGRTQAAKGSFIGKNNRTIYKKVDTSRPMWL